MDGRGRCAVPGCICVGFDRSTSSERLCDCGHPRHAHEAAHAQPSDAPARSSAGGAASAVQSRVALGASDAVPVASAAAAALPASEPATKKAKGGNKAGLHAFFGEQFIKPVLIFRGKGMRISAVEKAAWNPGVYHVFQENAWADRAVCEEVMKHVVVEAVRKKAAETGDDSWWLYLCDNLDGHKCDGFKNASATGKVQVHYHAVDTTDMSQVRGRVQCRAVRSLVCVSVCITAMEAGWRVYQSVLCRRWTAAAAGA